MWSVYLQVVSVEGQTLQCELGSEDHSRQTEIFREAQASFSRYQRSPPPLFFTVRQSTVKSCCFERRDRFQSASVVVILEDGVS